jgi:hypothetical protein
MSHATAAPTALRRVDSPGAVALTDDLARFEDLQTVLLACERVLGELASDGGPDALLVESVWTTALLSYARCFTTGGRGGALTEADLAEVSPGDEVVAWHQALLGLRDHYASPAVNPRERFTVGVALDGAGGAEGLAITSGRQPLVDEVTVRQTGAIAYALLRLVDGRIATTQGEVFARVAEVAPDELARLATLEVVDADPVA